MSISYKNKIYTTLGTPTTLSGDVVSAANSAGVPAKDYTVKGKSIVWNQLLDKSKYPATTTQNGVTFTNNGYGGSTDVTIERGETVSLNLESLKSEEPQSCLIAFTATVPDTKVFVDGKEVDIDSIKATVILIDDTPDTPPEFLEKGSDEDWQENESVTKE